MLKDIASPRANCAGYSIMVSHVTAETFSSLMCAENQGNCKSLASQLAGCPISEAAKEAAPECRRERLDNCFLPRPWQCSRALPEFQPHVPP